jgi:hypothetical protein
VAVDAIYHAGGRNTLDGVPGNDLQNNTRLGATYAHAITRSRFMRASG